LENFGKLEPLEVATKSKNHPTLFGDSQVFEFQVTHSLRGLTPEGEGTSVQPGQLPGAYVVSHLLLWVQR